MKKIFTLLVAFVGLFLAVQSTSALTYTVTVPAGTNACYIAGEMNGWSPSATRLTMVNATTYSIDLPDATESMKYQYLSGPDWKYIEKTSTGEGVSDRVWSANDVVAAWASVFVLDAREVTIEALVPSDVVELYLVGSFNSWASPSAAYKMTFDSQTLDGKVFSIKVFSEDAKNMEFKFVAGPSWAYEQVDPTSNYVYGTTENTTSVVVNSFKAYFDIAKAGTINLTATVPAGTQDVYIQGDFLGYDMTKAIQGVKNTDGTFSFSLPSVLIINYRLYNKADWGFPEVDETGKERATRNAVYPTDANISVTVLGWLQTISGFTNAKEAQNLIYSEDNMVYVDAVKSHVQIFDISGRSLESANITGTFKSSRLNAGLYVVNVDGATRKVVVR